MPDLDVWNDAKALLEGLSDLEVRELCIQALRERHGRFPLPCQFSVHGELGREVLRLRIADLPNVRLQHGVDRIKEVFLEALDQPWMTPVVEFMDWFVRAGFAFPLSSTPNAYPITLRLTRVGVRFLEQTDDHPLTPGHIDRLRTRCPGLGEDIVSLLADCRKCFDHALLRPAVVVMGVAYETAVESVAESLVTAGALPPNVLDLGAARRLADVRRAIDTHLPAGTAAERDHRFAVHAAYDFADQLRRRRNDASHTTPRYGFEDRQEIEEFLVSASRHLPPLWSLRL